MKKKRLNVTGWRGVNHSFALVNQFQLLALRQFTDIDITHTDYPFIRPSWNELSNSSGLNPNDVVWLKSIPQSHEGDHFDWHYQIYSPAEYKRYDNFEKTIVYLITEVGVDAEDAQIAKLINAANSGEIQIVTPSSWSKLCLNRAGFDQSSVRVIPHAASKDYFFPINENEIQQSRASLNVQEDDIVLLNISSPFWNKGVDILIRSFARAILANKKLMLIVKDQKNLYGIDGKNSILQSIHEFNIEPDLFLSRIRIIQENLNLHQLRTLYNIADWYISPYRGEGFNLPVCEALACGTPVIVTGGGATDDFVKNCSGIKIDSRSMTQLDPSGKEMHYTAPNESHLVDELTRIGRDTSMKISLDERFNDWNYAAKEIMNIFSPV